LAATVHLAQGIAGRAASDAVEPTTAAVAVAAVAVAAATVHLAVTVRLAQVIVERAASGAVDQFVAAAAAATEPHVASAALVPFLEMIPVHIQKAAAEQAAAILSLARMSLVV
jgi:hypothetical protein